MPDIVDGFAPNYYYNQQSAGLGIYIAAGIVNGTTYQGGFFAVPANSTTYFWVTSNGQIQSGSELPANVL